VQRKEHELREEVDATQRRNTETVEPELRRLEESIVEAREDLARADASVEAQRKTKAELNARVAALKSEKQKIAEELAATRIELGKVKADPDRLTYVPRLLFPLTLTCPLSFVSSILQARPFFFEPRPFCRGFGYHSPAPAQSYGPLQL
jgi:ABC-type Na+ efflux pump permease subunit